MKKNKTQELSAKIWVAAIVNLAENKLEIYHRFNHERHLADKIDMNSCELKGNNNNLGLKRSLRGCTKPNMHFCITLHNCLA